MSTMSKESGMMSNNGLMSSHYLGVNGWGSNTDLNWSLNGDWSGDIDIVNNLSNMNFWLDLSDLWSDLSMSSDWCKDLFLGHKGSKISSLSSSEVGDSRCGDGVVGYGDGWCNCGSGFNDGGVIDSNGWSGLDVLDMLDMLNGWGRDDVLLNGNCLKGWSLKVWDGWFDDLLRISSNDGSGFVVDGLGDWNGNMSNGRCVCDGVVSGHSRCMSNGVVGHGRLGNNSRGSNNWSSHTHSQRLSRGWELLDNTSWGGDDHGGHEWQEDQRVHF
jgi:hypothetical protein